ncbi:MAG: metal-dependent transcriptional regulator [Desulfatibacillaceae bacterium]
MNDPLSESMEDYLEAIFHIEREKRAARAKDIAHRLGVKAPSVTGALRVLADKGLINYAPYDVITLTNRGKRKARDVVARHDALYDFFVKVLCIDSEEADDAACKMEHVVSPNILDRLLGFVQHVEDCPRAMKWRQETESFCRQGKTGEDCEHCEEAGTAPPRIDEPEA